MKLTEKFAKLKKRFHLRIGGSKSRSASSSNSNRGSIDHPSATRDSGQRNNAGQAEQTASGAAPTQAEFQADEHDFTPLSTPIPPREDNPQTSSSAFTYDEGSTQEMERADLGARQMKSPAQPRHGGSSSVAILTNAQNNKISGCTFHNVAHIHESNSPAPGGASMLQLAGLASLPLGSIATHYLHCNHLQVAPPSAVSISLHPPSFYHEMKTTGSLALLLWFIKMMWTRQRTIQHL